MATVFKPPMPPLIGEKKSVFLAGTIDNGKSADWQADVEVALADLDIAILNPRRNDWDSSWEQTIENEEFRVQVEWELDGLEQVDSILMYFAPNSLSPITLLELGLFARSKKVILISPSGFWRRGNLEVVANRFNIPLYDNLEEGISALIKYFT